MTTQNNNGTGEKHAQRNDPMAGTGGHHVCETEYLVYDNLALMDGNRMSGSGILAGAWLVDGRGQPLLPPPMTAEEMGSVLRLTFGQGSILLEEDRVCILGGATLALRWRDDKTPLSAVEEDRLLYEFNGMRYALRVIKGRVIPGDTILLAPVDGELTIAPERLEDVK